MVDYHFYERLTPVGREFSVRLVTNGPLKDRHLRGLMRMLDVDLACLLEDEAAACPQTHVPAEERPQF